MKLLYVHEVLLLTIHREYLVGLLTPTTADYRRSSPTTQKCIWKYVFYYYFLCFHCFLVVFFVICIFFVFFIYSTCPKALTQCRFPVCIPYKTTVPKRIEVISEWIFTNWRRIDKIMKKWRNEIQIILCVLL